MHITFLTLGKTGLRSVILACIIAAVAVLTGGTSAQAEDVNCLMCHEQLGKEKVVHQALSMGCPTCHSAIDAREMPHKKTGQLPKGLSSNQPDLCYGCHDKAKFSKKTVHAAIGMGCTGCHNPHSSKNAKLLQSDQPTLCYNCHDKAKFTKKTVHAAIGMGCTGCHNPHSTDSAKLLQSEPPALCYNCHDKKKFEGKFVHSPVTGGMCTSCHSPHSTDSAKLLQSEPPALCYNCHDKGEFTKKNVHMPVAGGLCLSCHKPHVSDHAVLLTKDPFPLCIECHGNVRKTPHAVAGFSSAGHPLGEPKKRKREAEDPLRSGKKFYCGSCHTPHSSDSIKLFRYPAASSFDLCVRCHKM